MSVENPYIDIADRALILVNEHSTSAVRVAKEYQNLAINNVVVPTSENTEQMFDAIQRHRGSDRIVMLIAGGDGTVNGVGNAIMSPQGQEADLPDIPLVPLRGGNANDLAHMLNGRSSIDTILRRGRQASFFPLEVTVDGKAPRFVFSYFSIGATAVAAHELDKAKAKAGRPLGIFEEPPIVVRGTLNAPSFNYKHVDTEQFRPVFDITCVRGNLIAKYGRTGARLDDESFKTFFEFKNTRGRLIAKMASLLTGQLSGRQDQSLGITLGAPKPDAKVPLVQYDGEVASIDWNDHVVVAVARRSYTALTTRY